MLSRIRTAGEGHGRPSPALSLALAVLAFMFSSFGMAGQSDGFANDQSQKHTVDQAVPGQATPAGRALTPGQWVPVNPRMNGTYNKMMQQQKDPSAPTAEELSAARGMEAMMVNLMIEEMRKSVPENELVPVSQGERIFGQMLDQEYGRMLTESGGIGVADLVLAQIRGKR